MSRIAAVLASLLLSGCALLMTEAQTPLVKIGTDSFEICRGPMEDSECLVQPIDGDVGDDGYALTCQDVDEETCREIAGRVAADVGPPREVRWVVVWPDWQEVCWVGPSGEGCSGEGREPARP